MGHVDVSDQLRNYYRFDHYMRKRKWWWSIAFWGIGVQLVNAYVVYCKVMEASGVPKKKWLSHYDFRRSVALDWINQKEEKTMTRKREFATMEYEDDDDDSDEGESCRKPKSINGSGLKKDKDVPDSGSRRVSNRLKTKEDVEEDSVRRSVRVTDGSLAPNGTLNKRLRRDLFHWPKQAKTNQRCTLHRWASGVELKDKVLRCTDCEVHLCVNCYQLFHMVTNLVEKKQELGEMFLKEQQERSKFYENKTPDNKQSYEFNFNLEEMLNEAITSPTVQL